MACSSSPFVCLDVALPMKIPIESDLLALKDALLLLRLTFWLVSVQH